MILSFRRTLGAVRAAGRAIRLGRCRLIGKSGQMTRLLLVLIAGWLVAGVAARADEQMIEEYDGHNSLTTSDFLVPNGWEIRWTSEQVLSVGVIELDNTVIAGATGHDMGSLFVPQGGHYRLVVRGADPIPWDIKIYALGPVMPPDDAAEITNYQPTPGPDYKPPPKLPVVAPMPVVATPPAVPVAPAPPSVPTELSADQRLTIATVKGDRTQGAGFFLKTGTGTVVITRLGLLSNNPNLEIDTASGTKVTITQIRGASDRDVAMISVKDFGYPGLEPGDPIAVQPGDSVLTVGENNAPYPSKGVVSVGPERIGLDHFHALAGAPVVEAKTGKVVGVVSTVVPAFSGDNFTDQSFADREDERSEANAPVALRFDNVPGWETYTWDRLQNQTMFLAIFHQQTRALDSYLNGNNDEGSKLWQSDDKIKSANQSFLQDTVGGNASQRVEALHALLFELGVIADTDMDQIALPGNFSLFEGKRAQSEMAYRQALKAQIESYGDNVSHFNSVVIRNN
jgi:hypothetical protein